MKPNPPDERLSQTRLGTVITGTVLLYIVASIAPGVGRLERARLDGIVLRRCNAKEASVLGSPVSK
jgi:hypothetical protein